jgi:hypothetical protein
MKPDLTRSGLAGFDILDLKNVGGTKRMDADGTGHRRSAFTCSLVKVNIVFVPPRQ